MKEETMFWINYNLLKDGSFISQGCKTEAERDKEIERLKSFGYKPRKSKDGKQ
jgi:hypothetical protein